MKTDRLQIRNKFIKEENKPYIMPNNDDHNYTSDYVKWLEDKLVKNINYTRCCMGEAEQLQAYVKWKETTDIDLGAYTEKEQLGLYFDSL